MERLIGVHICLSPDDKAGGGQPVLPGMEQQLPLKEGEKEKKQKGRGGRYVHPQGHETLVRAPESLRNKPLAERKDLD